MDEFFCFVNKPKLGKSARADGTPDGILKNKRLISTFRKNP